VSRILLVEDEENLALGLRFNLENAGYEVRVVATGEEAIECVARDRFDLILLDITLAGELDGYQTARSVRKAGHFVPIVMLTARESVPDRVRGLDAGADDYVTKPFELPELMARVRGHLRRRVWARRGGGGGDPAEETIHLGEAEVCLRTRRAVTAAGEEVSLSTRELELLRYFWTHEGEVLTRPRLLEEVWKEPGTLETRTVDNFVLRLRRLFEPEPRRPVHFLTVRGAGYRFVR